MSEASPAPMSNPEPTLPTSDTVSSDEEEHDLSHLPPAQRNVVRRLQGKIQQATSLLDRLRTENERLRQRVEELERRPAIPMDKTALALDDDPEALRERISAFIETIDTYLEADPTDSEEPEPSPSGDASS